MYVAVHIIPEVKARATRGTLPDTCNASFSTVCTVAITKSNFPKNRTYRRSAPKLANFNVFYLTYVCAN